MAAATEASGRRLRLALWVIGLALLALGVVMILRPGPGVIITISGLLVCLVALVLTVTNRR